MPELPEVETTVRDLSKKVLNRTFVDIWADEKKIIKKDYSLFKKELQGKAIKNIYRKGKNIVFELSGGYSMLVHLKMTGHFLYSVWDKNDPMNAFVHVRFFLDNNKVLAFSDLRKFAKIELKKTEEIERDLKKIGPDPLELSLGMFKGLLKTKRGKIKQVLMDQEIVSGIGNIYSDEILWEARVHPEKQVADLSDSELKLIYGFSKKVLKKAIEKKGTSISDFRTLSGEKGEFGKVRKVYRREGEACFRCGKKIVRKMIGQRSAHFCPFCQKP